MGHGSSGFAIDKDAPSVVRWPRLSQQRRLDGALQERLCALDCSGTLQLWRYGDSGPVALITHQGDIDACSHPPYRWFSAHGEEVLVQEERPVSPEEAERAAAKREALTAGMVKAERLRCL